MSKFDSYYNPPDEPAYCAVCGLDVDNCICPECPVCGVIGCPMCYEDHGMFRSNAQIESLEKVNAYLKAEAKAEIDYIDKIIKETYEL